MVSGLFLMLLGRLTSGEILQLGGFSKTVNVHKKSQSLWFSAVLLRETL